MLNRRHFDSLVDPFKAIFTSYWSVCDSYRLANGWICEAGVRRTPYAPLRQPDLFLSFARLRARGEPSEASIMRWVSKYGLLTLEIENEHEYGDFASQHM